MIEWCLIMFDPLIFLWFLCEISFRRKDGKDASLHYVYV